MSADEFSLEQSEELIANLKSGAPTELEQLRSALNLLAHVPEMPPLSVPPVLPSQISQPAPVIPIKSAKSRRTILTSAIVTGFLASASLAAAAVTGIGPAPIVNIGHQTAKFVKGVAGAVTHVVTGGNSDTTDENLAAPRVAGLTPAPTTGDNGSQDNSSENSGGDESGLVQVLAPITNLLTFSPPSDRKTPQGKSNDGKSNDGKSNDGKSNDGKSSNSGDGSSNSSHENQSQTPDNLLPLLLTPAPSPINDEVHSDIVGQPTVQPTELASPSSSEESDGTVTVG